MKDGKYEILYNHYKVRKGELTRGKHSWIGKATIDLTGDILLGAYSYISHGVQVFTHRHEWNHSRQIRKKIQRIVPVNLDIGSDVYIGVSAIVLAVSKISKGATIGAGSVLTKDVPAYEIWAGNPAKKIGERGKGEDMGFGKTYDEFKVGDVYEHSFHKTVTESDNNLFCMLTGNHHPVHLDNEYALKAHHGQILVVGTYILSLVVGMSVPDTSGKALASLGFKEIKHVNPVFIGDTINSKTRVLDKRESKSNLTIGIVTLETSAYNQHSKLVLSFIRSIMVAK